MLDSLTPTQKNIMFFWILNCEDMSIPNDPDGLVCRKCKYYEDCLKLRELLNLRDVDFVEILKPRT